MTDLANKRHPFIFIIAGMTEEGIIFRPTDWAERISGNLCSFHNHRIAYSPLLQPMTKNGIKYLVMDSALENLNNELYQSIINFAKENQLKITLKATALEPVS